MCCGSPGPALVPAVFAVPARGARVAALTHSSAANKYHRAQVEKGGVQTGTKMHQQCLQVRLSNATSHQP